MLNPYQFAFDTAARGVIQQGGPAIFGPNPFNKAAAICAYRAVNGFKCGIGHIIPNTLYSPYFEYGSIKGILNSSQPASSRLVEYFAKLFDVAADSFNFETSVITFLTALQSCHDDATESLYNPELDFLTEFKRRLSELAACHNLDTSALNA